MDFHCPLCQSEFIDYPDLESAELIHVLIAPDCDGEVTQF